MGSQLSLFDFTAPVATLPVSAAKVTTSLQALIARDGGGPACSRVRVDMPELVAPTGYPILHAYQMYPGLMVVVELPQVAHFEAGPVLTRIHWCHLDGEVSFGVGGYAYNIHTLPTPMRAYPTGHDTRPNGWALLVAGDPVIVHPDRGAKYRATLLDTLWMRPERSEVKLRVRVEVDGSRWDIKRVAISNITVCPDFFPGLEEQRVLDQSWYAATQCLGKEVARA